MPTILLLLFPFQKRDMRYRLLMFLLVASAADAFHPTQAFHSAWGCVPSLVVISYQKGQKKARWTAQLVPDMQPQTHDKNLSCLWSSQQEDPESVGDEISPHDDIIQEQKKKQRDKDLVQLEEMDWETSLLEQKQAQKIWFKLMAPYEIGRYVNTVVTTGFWIFVAGGTLLNVFGYAFVLHDGHLNVDTLQNKQFQDEIARGLREAANNIPKKWIVGHG